MTLEQPGPIQTHVAVMAVMVGVAQMAVPEVQQYLRPQPLQTTTATAWMWMVMLIIVVTVEMFTMEVAVRRALVVTRPVSLPVRPLATVMLMFMTM